MYRRVLVPTDGGDGTDVALDHALNLAQTYDAELHAVFVVDVASVPAETNAAQIVGALEQAGEAALAVIADAAERAGVDATTAVVEGSAARGITDYADDEDIDLIVMATHGRQGLDRYLLGSVTERVVRTSPVPVLTVRLSDGEA